MADFEIVSMSSEGDYIIVKEQPNVTYILIKDDDGE